MNPHELLRPDITVELEAQPRLLAIVRHFASSLATDLELTPEESLQLELCVDEVCANSIDGIRQLEGDSPSSLVRVEFIFDTDTLHIVVLDRGEDFSKSLEKANPLDDSTDRTQKRGYGLQIIKTFMDEIHYTHDPESGNRLHLVKCFASLHEKHQTDKSS